MCDIIFSCVFNNFATIFKTVFDTPAARPSSAQLSGTSTLPQTRNTGCRPTVPCAQTASQRSSRTVWCSERWLSSSRHSAGTWHSGGEQFWA